MPTLGIAATCREAAHADSRSSKKEKKMTMSVSKLTGDKRRWRQYKARTRQLPANYRAAIDALQRYLLYFGPGTGDGVTSMLEDLVDLAEHSAADRTGIRGFVGEDPVEFAEAFLRHYPQTSWITRERKRLTTAIDVAADGDKV
jgi:DNA-binding ferritin-like protein (Dps family)